MFRLVGFIAVSFSLNAMAAARTQTALTTELKAGSFLASVKDGFHFNEKAPNSLILDGQTLKPAKLSSRSIEFGSVPEKFKSGRANLYICDDALTFCEPRTIDLKNGPAPSVEKAKGKPGKLNKHSFLEDDFSGALQEAKAKGALVLVDFSARWCPGCMRMEAEIFGTKTFQETTKGFVKVKLDVDRFENSVIKDKFRIWGIPTLLVLTADQDEVVRLYDYQPMSVLNAFFARIAEDPSTLSQLEAKAKAGDKGAAMILGQRLAMAGQTATAVEYLSKIQPAPPELLMAQVNLSQEAFSQDPTKKADFAKALKGAIESEPRSSRSIEWREMLVGVLEDKSEIAKVAAEGSALADALLQDDMKLKEAMKTDLIGEFTGFEPLKIALNRAELMASADSGPDIQKQAWMRAAQVGQKLGITAANSGVAVRYLSILIKAEDFKAADQLSQLLLKKAPNDPEMQYRRLKVLMATKRYAEAIDMGTLCLKGSYGRNEFMIAENLAKAYVAEKRKAEAKTLLDKYLARSDLNWPTMQASRKALEDLRRSL